MESFRGLRKRSTDRTLFFFMSSHCQCLFVMLPTFEHRFFLLQYHVCWNSCLNQRVDSVVSRVDCVYLVELSGTSRIPSWPPSHLNAIWHNANKVRRHGTLLREWHYIGALALFGLVVSQIVNLFPSPICITVCMLVCLRVC